MIRLPLHRLLWGVAAFLLAAAVAVSAKTYRLVLSIDDTAPRFAPVAGVSLPVSEALDSAVAEVRHHDLFQPSRRPPLAPRSNPPPPSPAPASSRPQLELRGILGGPPWNAVIAGMPGTSTDLVVREGDTVNGLHIASITSRTVVVLGRDTTWTLVLIR